ncbi:MAG: SBBP repeat-containing protein, partial [Deltaproteobacteria bacterium]|nr:SBBP repeat-containing protein [Deltaproteobacteria bacterium]
AGHATYFTKEGVGFLLIGKETSASIKLSFIGANENPEIIAEGLQAGKVNYFIGNDQSKWRTNIPTYSSVLYNDVYEGIDIRFYGNNQKLEYDVIVKPGADPNIVRFSYEGIEGLKVTDNGDMEIALKHGKITQKKPYVYQELDGKRIEVDGRFVITPSPPFGKGGVGGFAYSFSLASFDATKPLVIDPSLVYSTFLGGSCGDEGNGIAVDSSGNAYITGSTCSSDFPTVGPIDPTLGETNVFVTKINSAGTALVYSTYLGGGGPGHDYGNAIAVDSSGNAYVTGTTGSSDFPVVNAFDNAFSGPWDGGDAFVAKLNPAGSALVFSTYLGTIGLVGGESFEYGEDLAVQGSYVYVTGMSSSTVFNDQDCSGGDAFVTRLSSTGAHMYTRCIGGSDYDYGYGIAVDSSGSAYVTGFTYSSDFPTVGPLDPSFNGYTDAFVTKINSAGTLVYSAYLGGNDADRGYGIALDSANNAYVTGLTYSSNFPTVGAIDPTYNAVDAFVTKINVAGSALVYSTFLGGGFWDWGNDIAVDSSNNAYVTGYTASSDFPTVNPIDGTLNYDDAFVTKINAGGTALSYSTYLGGTGLMGDWGYGIALDSSGNAYVTGMTDSSDFPTTASYDNTYNGWQDAFITKISPTAQTWFEENHSSVAYTGTWTNYSCTACSAGAVKYSKQVGAKATFTFTGKGVKWYAAKANLLGKAKVYIDGVLQTTVDLYSSTSKVKQVVYTKTWTSSGSHTIRIDVTGTKNVNSTNTYIDIDAFEITP